MKDLLRALDAAIIGAIERVCHRFQHLTGKTNYFLSRWFCAICGITSLWWGMSQTPREWLMIVPASIAFLWCLLSDKAEQDAFRRIRKRTANPLKRRLHLLRLFGIGSSFLFVVDPNAPCVVFASITMVNYLLACDPLPPCDGKIKEWLMNMFLKPAKIRVDSD